jgi:hypothetical protein
MNILILVFAILGVFLTARYFSLAGTKWYLFSLRERAFA